MKKQTRFFMLVAMLFFAVGAFAQNRTITGTVTDESGEPLVAATVRVTGTNAGTVTDLDGRYQISAPSSAETLTVSYVGKKNQVININEDGVVNITLTDDVNSLEGVVVTALGIERDKRAVGYSAQDVSKKQLDAVPQTSVTNALVGKVAGLQLQGDSGARLNSDGKIRLRGALGLTSEEALYVVDGVVTSSYNGNPGDIANVTVLKGPNATALYGIRGAGGAIIITTRSGKNTQGISFRSDVIVENVNDVVNYQNEYAGGDGNFQTFNFDPSTHPAEWEVFDGKLYKDYSDDSSWGPRMDGTEYIPWYAWYQGTPNFGRTERLTPKPNNVRDFWETGIQAVNTLTFGKVFEGSDLKLSYTNDNIKGLLPNSSSDKHMVNAKFNLKMNEWLSAGINANYSTRKLNGDFGDGYANNAAGNFNQWGHRDADYNQMRAMAGTMSIDGTLISPNHLGPNNWLTPSPNIDGISKFNQGVYWYNPYDYFNNVNSIRNIEALNGNAYLKFTVTPNLSVTGTIQRDQDNRVTEGTVNGILERSAYQSGTRAAYSTGRSNDKENNYELKLNYDKKWGDFEANMFLAGNNRKNTYSNHNSGTSQGLNVPGLYTLQNSAAARTIGNYRERYENNSVYGGGFFSWKDMLYLDVTARNDWSSALPENDNSYFYPSIAGSFVFTELMDQNSILSYGKLRGGFAQVGSDLDPYQTKLNYGVGANLWNGAFLTGTPNTLIDPAIKPAVNGGYELGFDLKFLEGRYGLSATYFSETRKDEILTVPITGNSGFTSYRTNAGDFDRSGLELQLDIIPIKTDNFSWEINSNWATVKSMVNRIADGIDEYNYSSFQWRNGSGTQIYHKEGEEWGQLVGSSILRNDAGVPILTSSGRYQIDDRNASLGSVLPDFTGGFFNTLTYKDLTLRVSLDYSKGGQFYSLTNMWGTFSGILEDTAGLNDKGNPKRDPVSEGGGVHVTGVDESGNAIDMYMDAYDYYHQHWSSGLDEPFVSSLSFVKMREINLGYNVPVGNIGALDGKVQRANIAFIARNPWLIYSGAKNFDSSEAATDFGETGQLPGTRSFGVSLNVGF